MRTKRLNVGIISKENYKKRTIAIAQGKYIPKKDEPKIWFESIQSIAQVLSSENQKLLALIIANKPQSITELEQLSGRRKSNLSRTLKTLERYGIVDLDRENRNIIPRVKATDFRVEFGLQSIA